MNASLRLSGLPLAVAVVLAAGCNPAPAYKSPQGHPTVPMTIGAVAYTLEVVRTEANRARGLMHRDTMPADWGMIFVFPGPNNEGGFWMRNTRIPLDILYVDANGAVVSVHRMEPFDEHSTVPARPYKYAIELNAGQAARNGVKPGTVLVIPADAKETAE